MSTGGKKQYGLIVPQKSGVAAKRPNVFGDDSDSGDDDGGDWVKKAFKRDADKGVQKRATKLQIKKALEEDPTVYQYDEIYDDLEQKKVEEKAVKKGVEKKPRYIQALLQTAERRKKELERRVERQVQKEREAEGEEFADKESFVTASYRQKLEEFKKQEEEEKRMERLEAIGDVTKQKDLTGFYRHLLRQTMGETLPGADLKEIKTEKTDGDEQGGDANSPSISKDKEDTNPKTTKEKKERQYRKRRSSSGSSSSESDVESKKVEVKEEKNVDSDSDFTGSSSSSSSESESGETGSEEGEIRKKVKTELIKRKSVESSPVKEKKTKLDDGKEGSKTKDKKEAKDKKSKPDAEVKEESDIKKTDKLIKEEKKEDIPRIEVEKENEKPKVNIWAKRTVGEVFDDAVQRYYERKALRAASRGLGRS